MKLYSIISSMAIMASTLFLTGCSSDEPDTSSSVITVPDSPKNEFDKWLDENFVKPYNIDFKYRYEDIEGDFDYYLIPARYDDAIMMAHLVKYLCIETYVKVGGNDFTCTYFPKMFYNVGEWEYNNNHSIVLGTSESGRKIFLAGLNYLPSYVKSALLLNEFYFKTIHHEFVHVLNQNKPIPTTFQPISSENYVSGMWNQDPYNKDYLLRGFISDYAQDSYTEDFAEMMSIYITNTAEWWEDRMTRAGDEGSTILKLKLDIVRSYMLEQYDIDLDELRDELQSRQAQVIAGNVDLTDISI
ncbi:MAG: putative zinc-binding metallopeptidase [Muribaculaceae bacterium]|nr:putative zinc-binding metallopeptidase [Muribaculaceae bacterium]